MRKQDHLVSLISSLTQGEKKFFIQHSRNGKEAKGYLKLYELLCRQNSYNPEAICKALGKSKTALANEKKYLENNLLTCLRLYHKNNAQVNILNSIADGVLLMERGQPEMATASIKNAITEATGFQQYPLAFHSHGLMLTLSSEPFNSFSQTEDVAEHHLLKMKEFAEQIKLTVAFEMLNAEVFTAYSKRKKDTTDAHRKETRRLLNNRLLKNAYSNFDLMCYKYNLQALLYARLGDTAANVEANKKCLSVYEQLNTIDVLGYWNAIANLTQSIIAHSSEEMYRAWMDKLDSRYYRHLPVDTQQIDKLLLAQKSIFTAGAYFNLLNKTAIAHETIRPFTKKFIKRFAYERKQMTTSHLTTTVYKVAACSFIIGDTSDCIDLLNRLFREVEENTSPDIYKNAKLLYVLAHAEWNKLQLFPGLIPGVINYMKKHEQYGPVEQVILKHFSLLNKPCTTKERKLWILKLREIIDSLSCNKETCRTIELVPYKQWLERINYN